MAKAEGCTVIRLAGENAKCAWIKWLCFDHAIIYKTTNINAALKEIAPKGVDIYFDNVGGMISSITMHQMNVDGRVTVCGSISSYTTLPSEMEQVPVLQPTTEGFEKTPLAFID